jgi:CO/xanthine dehydrogenase Mo-binding subunit
MPGVLKIVRDGSFLAVIAEREEEAVRAWEFLQAHSVWATDSVGESHLPEQAMLREHLQSQPAQSFLIVNGTAVTDPIPEKVTPSNAVQTLRATYFRPFHMHASLGPPAGVAWMEGGKLTVWAHAQGVYPVRAVIAHGLGMAEGDVHVIHREGPGCYGQNGADDAAFDAALLARAFPGRPVSLKWMREDEHRWEPYGPAMAMAMAMEASLDAGGEIVAWNHEVWSYPHLGRPRAGAQASGLLAAWDLAEPFARPKPQPSMWTHVGGHRNADPLYVLSNKRVVKHWVAESPFRTSSMRGLGAYGNVFAIESFMDELAHAAGVDPVAFRLRYLVDARAREVLEALPSPPAPLPAGEGSKRGRGVAFARYKNRATYCAVMVDVSVHPETGEVRLERAVIAADAGQIVKPDGLSNQLEGGLIQAASWTLKEQVQFDRAGVTSVDWETYPLLKFAEVPVVETILLNRPVRHFWAAGRRRRGRRGRRLQMRCLTRWGWGCGSCR